MEYNVPDESESVSQESELSSSDERTSSPSTSSSTRSCPSDTSPAAEEETLMYFPRLLDFAVCPTKKTTS